MASYNVQITRSLKLSARRKWNEFVAKRGLKLSAKKRRDEWIQNFGSSSVAVRRKMRFRFP